MLRSHERASDRMDLKKKTAGNTTKYTKQSAMLQECQNEWKEQPWMAGHLPSL